MRVTLCRGGFRQHLLSAFEDMVELTQDFTDSAYTPHEHREKILLLCDRAKLELNQLLRLGICLVSLQIALQYYHEYQRKEEKPVERLPLGDNIFFDYYAS